MLARLCVALIVLYSSAGRASAAIEDKYRQLKTFSLGAVVITAPHVTIVGPKETGPGIEKVTFLQLDRGIVHIRTASGEELSAEIGQGTDKDPAANFSGVFEWKNGVLVRFTLEKLHLRLRHATSTSTLFGGKLRLDPNSNLFIENLAPVVTNDASATGRLSLATFGSQIIEPKISLQGVPINVTLTSSSTKENLIGLDLESGKMRAEDAVYNAKTGEASAPITASVFSRDKISGGLLSIEGMQLLVERGARRLTIAAAHIAHPVIEVTGYDKVPVVEAQEYVARNISAEVTPGDELRFDNVRAAETFAIANPWGVVNQLNSLGIFAPDVLIPTGNPDVRYIRPADLGKLYESFSASIPKSKKITTILIQQTDGIVTKVVVDLGPAPSIKDSVGEQQNPVCFLVETVAGLAAGAAVDALFAEVPLYAATNVWLRVTNPLNPRFAVPSFVTTFAVSKGTVKLFGSGFDYKGVGFDGLAAAVAGGVAGQYCEVLVSKLPNRIVFTKPNYLLRPLLFETIQTSPNALFTDEIAMKHQLYLANTVKVSELLKDPRVRAVLQGDKRQSGTLETLVNVNQIVEAKAFENLAAQVKEAQDRDNMSAGQRGGAEGQNLATSAVTAQLTQSQIREDQRLKEQQDNVTKEDPNAHVPGTPMQPPPAPPKPPTVPRYEPCPSGEPCPVVILSTKPSPPKEK